MFPLTIYTTEGVGVTRAWPRWKKLFFGVIIAILLLSLLEFLLVLLGTEPIVAYKDPYIGFDASIPHFERRGEVGEPLKMRIARNKLPWFNEQDFTAAKQDGTYRVFCLGGSTTFGRPYDDKTSFCGWLREFLAVAHPAQTWEVINAGGVSYASYRVAALMEEIVAYEPDLFIVYTGHNEFLEERTYRDVLARSTVPRWLATAAVRTRIGALLESLLISSNESAPSCKLSAVVETALDKTIGPSSYERNDDLVKKIAEHYELSLDRMIALARSVGADIVFIRPACKLLHCSPFKSVPAGPLPGEQRQVWQEQMKQGRIHLQNGRYAKALEALESAAAADGRFAESHFMLGETLFALGRYEQANEALNRAVNEDVCPLRMTAHLGAALDRVVKRRGVVMVDFARLLREHCLRQHGHPVLGSDYFLDHVHPSIEANGLLAQEIAKRLWELSILPGQVDLTRDILGTVKRLVYAGLDPVAHAQAEARLACIYHWAGKPKEAGPLALKSLGRYQEDPRTWLIAGIYLNTEGDHDRAEAHLRQAWRMSPIDPRIRQALESAVGDGLDR